MESLRSGDWITRERLRVYSLMLIATYVLASVAWLLSLRDGLDWQDRPFGSDFAQVYAAGTLVADRLAAAPYDLATHIARQRAIFGDATAVFSWNYPPYFLALARLLALFPYLGAFFVWQAATFALYLATMRASLRAPLAVLAAAAFPGVFENFGHGQTGFLVAALMGGGLLLLDKRPIAAGILFGLIAFKPHFGLLLPVALAAGGRWRSFLAAGATVVLMTLASYVAYGPDVWIAFLDSLSSSRLYGLENSNTGFFKMQSAFAAVRLLGGPVALAYIAHGLVFAFTAAGLARIWHSDADHRLKAAALLTGSILATPYAFDYDMVLLAPALAALVSLGLEKGFQPFEKSLFALVFAIPVIARPVAMTTAVPLGLLVTIVLFGHIIRRASSGRGQASLCEAAASPKTFAKG